MSVETKERGDDRVVSFSKGPDRSFEDSEEDDIQISLAPYIQTYLTQGTERTGCLGRIPILFERASTKSWFEPRFDSEILENQYRQSAFPQIRLRFRYSLMYLVASSLVWSAYLTTYGMSIDPVQKDAVPLGVIFFLFSIFCLIVLIFTRSLLYRRYQLPVSILISLLMCLLSLASVSSSSALSPAGNFALCVEFLMILYTVIPLPLYLCVSIGTLYSISFEFFGSGTLVLERTLSHLCVHLIALHILIMTNVRMRGTFMKVGQSLLVRKQLEMEKQLKEKMIHSVMPPKVAEWLMSEGSGNYEETVRNPSGGDINSLFRPFNMNSVKDVSILFADIVGFTRMSSTKTASELVAILNVLFERFDDLCLQNGCEKISTLGDCYYCVSGCPMPRSDHAICCVQMGLGMIEAIAEFDRDHHEEVNMRVGVHTGTVLCGIVGRKRFKFDVWSNDVTLANKMESTGQPGRVHVSDVTTTYLNNEYILEPGDPFKGMKTYFIVEHRSKTSPPMSSTQITITSPSLSGQGDDEPVSYETAIGSQTDESLTVSLTTAASHHKDPGPEQDSPRLVPTGPSPLPRIVERLSEIRASSLPSLFSKESQGRARLSLAGSDNVGPRKPQFYKYSRLRPSKPGELENGKIQTTFRSSSILSDFSPDKSGKVHLDVPKEDGSTSLSMNNSRKDSGIKSNSRRSSIQQQLFVMNGIAHGDLLTTRVSGYYTSSQSSSTNDLHIHKPPSPPPGESIGMCLQKLRKQSDLQLIKCVQDNSKSERSYFVTPPIKSISLLFRQPELEKEYREKAHRTPPVGPNRPRTLTTARFNTYFDVTISLLVFTFISIGSFTLAPPTVHWLVMFPIFVLLQGAVIFLCCRSVIRPTIIPRLERFLSWYPWHAIGAALVSLPLVVILVNFRSSIHAHNEYVYSYCYLLFVGIVHYCNFTQLNCWLKSLLSTVGALVFLALISVALLGVPAVSVMNKESTSLGPTIFLNLPPVLVNSSSIERLSRRSPSNFTLEPFSQVSEIPPSLDIKLNIGPDPDPPNISSSCSDPNDCAPQPYSESVTNTSFLTEIFFDVFLLVLLVWFLNREFEISYRLSFHSNAVAARDKSRVQTMKDQADILLHNIIPRHVAEQLKTTARYSEDVKDVGIVFASIVNFGDMYEESYLDGKEFLRVLNELVSDFDELLNEPRFSMVEKIKTIGTTYMAASGLNLSQREPNDSEHLFQLMEFALALQAAVEYFNTHLLEFSLVLRVGYNFGDVTAGVIGTSKLFYDIWGDAVNIASRMDSTGVQNRIQVPAKCVDVLSQRYTFQHRGTVYVKGKDNMDVYLLDGHKSFDDSS